MSGEQPPGGGLCPEDLGEIQAGGPLGWPVGQASKVVLVSTWPSLAAPSDCLLLCLTLKLPAWGVPAQDPGHP